MIFIVTIAGLILVAGWIILIAAMLCAPEGFEDQEGFHRGNQSGEDDFESKVDDFELLRAYVAKNNTQCVAEARVEHEGANFGRTRAGVRQ
jgi:hypothetical protein